MADENPTQEQDQTKEGPSADLHRPQPKEEERRSNESQECPKPQWLNLASVGVQLLLLVAACYVAWIYYGQLDAMRNQARVTMEIFTAARRPTLYLTKARHGDLTDVVGKEEASEIRAAQGPNLLALEFTNHGETPALNPTIEKCALFTKADVGFGSCPVFVKQDPLGVVPVGKTIVPFVPVPIHPDDRAEMICDATAGTPTPHYVHGVVTYHDGLGIIYRDYFCTRARARDEKSDPFFGPCTVDMWQRFAPKLGLEFPMPATSPQD